VSPHRWFEAREPRLPEQASESETFNDLFFERPPRVKHPSSLDPEDRVEYLRRLGTFEALFTPAPERRGLRGDRFLWEELTASRTKALLSNSMSDLLKIVGKKLIRSY
jgi:hypothetical protein